MKVLDLQCAHSHVFEGWFASEDDFQDQQARGLVQCPLCGDASISKKLSAPRLNLSGAGSDGAATQQALALHDPEQAQMAQAWLEMGRRLLAETTDVGSQFAEEARKIHYGEAPERSIRGQTSVREARELLDEGISVLPLMVPEALKKPLQ
jgi:hypothetical protein